ncbi:GNAT family N-acetyltransferase [Rhizobium sp. YIM 134829]|uniref:GNAT family N-acetyltransferase n=1 Tax=Rhizobium sp. YIM 134829 TaxID=3390453 RepID=UPI00397A79BA
MAESPTIFTVPLFSDLCNLGFRLRRQVFIAEQGVPPEEEFDALDLTAHHLVAVLDGSVCGVLRVLAGEDPVRIGRVAVAREARGRGVGAALIRRVLTEFEAVADGRFTLSAQADKLGFYESFGFRASGEPYLDCGIPHQTMQRNPAAPTG